MKYETIYPNFLVPGNAHPFKQILLITKSTDGGHKPAVTIATLANITSSHTFDVEVRVDENILGESELSAQAAAAGNGFRSHSLAYLNPFHRHWPKVRMVLIECYQAVLTALIPLPLHEIQLDIEVWVFVLLIQFPTILYNLLNLSLACCSRLFIRRGRIFGGASFPRSLKGSPFGIQIVWEDCEGLAGILGCELLPELVNDLLRMDILSGLLRRGGKFRVWPILSVRTSGRHRSCPCDNERRNGIREGKKMIYKEVGNNSPTSASLVLEDRCIYRLIAVCLRHKRSFFRYWLTPLMQSD
jgi:hypothetical protein